MNTPEDLPRARGAQEETNSPLKTRRHKYQRKAMLYVNFKHTVEEQSQHKLVWPR